MTKTKPTPICNFKKCKKTRRKSTSGGGRFCCEHRKKFSVNAFLSNLYVGMSSRVKGKATYRPDLYLGLPILPRDVFMSWAKNHSDFLAMYKRWLSNDFDRKLTPSINRMNSSKGYVLGNIEWVTNSQNCGLSAEVRKMKNKKAIYDLLGVSNGKK